MQAKRKNGNTREEVLEILRELPNSTSKEVSQLMPHTPYTSISSMINWLYRHGHIVRGEPKSVPNKMGKSITTPTYVINPDPTRTTNVVRIQRKQPTEAALRLQIDELNEQVASLEEWKREAIRRHPELAVKPVVLQARALVAAELKASGDVSLAAQVERGDRDETLMMRVAVRALEEVE